RVEREPAGVHQPRRARRTAIARVAPFTAAGEGGGGAVGVALGDALVVEVGRVEGAGGVDGDGDRPPERGVLRRAAIAGGPGETAPRPGGDAPARRECA